MCVGRKIIDSSGLYTSLSETEDYKVGYDIARGMPLELLAKWLNEKHGWNPTFEAKVYKPVIAKRMKKINKNLVASI